MNDARVIDAIVEKALGNKGLVPLELLLAEFVPTERLRALARARGLTVKGFRIDAAPAPALAQALVRGLEPDLLADLCAELVAVLRSGATPAANPPAATNDSVRQGEAGTTGSDGVDRAELERLRGQLGATVAAQRKAEARAAELESRLAQREQHLIRLRGDLEAAERRGAAAAQPAAPDRDTLRALHEAEQELDVLARSEESYRRRLAEQQTTIRALTQRIEELEAMLPKDRRRKAPPSPPPPAAERFRVPHFTAEFYRSLEGRDQRSVEAAFDAVLRFSTAGYSYPGLEVKQLEGVDLWSMRAGIKVRVYFRPRPDGNVDIVAVGDREDQDTLLRRLR